MQIKNSLMILVLILGGVVVVAVAAYAGTRTGLNPWQDYGSMSFRGRTRVRQPADCASGMQ